MQPNQRKKSCADSQFHMDSDMKKPFLTFSLLVLLLPALAGCRGGYDYSVHVSELRSDIFRAETEEFTVTLSCVSREHPYCADGVTNPVSDVVEISLLPADKQTVTEYSVYVVGETKWGGEASFRNSYGDWFYSQGVDAFPQGSVTLSVEWDGNTRELTATSVKNENTLSPGEILSRAVKAEEEAVGRMTYNGAFHGEFFIRLLRREKNYYYVGIVGGQDGTIALLFDSETGEVLARRVHTF